MRRIRNTTSAAQALARTCVLAAMLAALAASGIAGGATSSSVVGATVPSSTLLQDSCHAAGATELGAVLPGVTALTATAGPEVCRFSFGSSNDSAALRIWQRDGAGSAMRSQGTAVQAAYTGDAPTCEASARHATVAFATCQWQDTVRRTTDGGATWTEVLGGTRFDDIGAFGPDDAWVANGTDLRVTGDGGTTWSSPPTTIPGPVTTIGVASDLVAWFGSSGGRIYRTADGGTTWQTSSLGSFTLRSISATSTSDVWAVRVGSANVWHSTDGGSSWTPTPSGALGTATDVDAIDGSVAWAVGDGGIASVTTDGGGSWTPRQVPVAGGIETVSAVSATTAWVGTMRGEVFRTGDGGLTWTEVDLPSTIGVDSIEHVGGSVVAGTTGGGIFHSAVGDGTDWNRTYGSGPQLMIDVHHVDDQVAVAVGGEGYLRRTGDGGTTWTTIAAPTTGRIAAVDGTRPGGLVAVGNDGLVLQSTDAGVTWSITHTGGPSLRDVAFVGSTGWAAGLDGTLLRSDDAGSTWRSVASGTTAALVSIDAMVPATVVVGTPTGLRTSTDGGATWTTPAAQPWSGAVNVSVAQPQVIWVHTAAGTIVRSTDLGATWSATLVGSVFDVAASSGLSAVTIDNAPTRIGVTRDGGATWTWRSSGQWIPVASIDALDASRAIAAGEQTSIWRLDPDLAIGDYASGTRDFATGDMFGVCLQEVSAATPVWTVDTMNVASMCEPDDSDPWQAVPTTPSTVASSAPGVTGTVSLVWGLEVGASTIPSSYSAGIAVEAIAP